MKHGIAILGPYAPGYVSSQEGQTSIGYYPDAIEISYHRVKMLNHVARTPLILWCDYDQEIFVFSEEALRFPGRP